MAVWGVSLLILSLTFLIHRHPPNTWRISWTLLPRPDQKTLGTRLDKHDVTKEKSTTDSKDETRPIEEKDEQDEEDDQKTPQATPAAPSLAIPTFNLDSANTETEAETERATASFPAANSPQRAMPPPQRPVMKSQPPSLMPPPSFPAPNSAQRASSSRTSPSSSLMPPPSARPQNTNRTSSLAIPSTQRTPPSTLSPAAAARAPPPSRIDTPTSKSAKVKLAPGFSPLDWASLAASSKTLSGVSHFTRVTPSLLALHNGRKGHDAWSVYHGKVYNLTPYAGFHPGGKGELMRGAGKDGTKMFLDVHPWVNWEAMLSSCLVGIMVSEGDGEGLDEMD